MSTINRPARLNRALLGVIGLLLVAVGAYAVAGYLGRLQWVHPQSSLVPGVASPPRWVLGLLIVGAVVLGLASLRWLGVQFARLPKSTVWQIGAGGPTGTTELASDTAADAVIDDLEAHAGVRSAAARLSGPARTPELHLVVTAEPHTDLTELRRHVSDHVLARLREALEVDVIPVTLELRLADRGRAARAR